jgi:hypothetical protein
MKLIIVLMFLAGITQAQTDTTTYKGELRIVMPIPFAKNLEYWGQKGITSEPLISGYETRIQILEAKIGFHEMINRNCTRAQEEYRTMVQNAAGINAKLEKELSEALNEKDKWQHKARNARQVLAFGSVVVGLLTYIQIAN